MAQASQWTAQYRQVAAVAAVASVLFRVAQVLASHSCVYNFIEEAGTKVLASQLSLDCRARRSG